MCCEIISIAVVTLHTFAPGELDLLTLLPRDTGKSWPIFSYVNYLEEISSSGVRKGKGKTQDFR